MHEGEPGKAKFEKRHTPGRGQLKSPRSMFQTERKIIVKLLAGSELDTSEEKQ